MNATLPDKHFGLAPIPHMVRRSRIGLHRAARRIAWYAVRSGVAERLAAGLAIVDRRRSLHLVGLLAGISRRHDDHTEFWKNAATAFPSYTDFTREGIHAALRSGRSADAEAGLERLIQTGAAVASDSRFVIGLTHIDRRAGDGARIRSRIRTFLGSLRGKTDCRIAAIRLSRVIFAHFPRKSEFAADASSVRSSFLNMLKRSSVRRAPRNLLARVAACEARLEIAFPRCLLNTDISPAERRAFVSLVRTRLARRQPFSFVRMGDGEAACLPYEPRLAALAGADAKDRERIWWGAPLRQELRMRMAPRVARAMWDADCIGIPTTARFLRELRLLKDDALETSLTGRGLRAILYCVERLPELRSAGLPAPLLTSCHLHQDLALGDCYGELLGDAKDLVLVSCHPGLADWICVNFHAGIAANVVLPPDRVSAPLMRERLTEDRSLPEMLDEVIVKVGDLSAGRLVLVGAGYPGKLLVAAARERGGVALDLGSIFDYWLGLNTRSYLDLVPV